MADTDFTKFVPGFDFLQGLVKNAGSAIPGFGQWVAPTLNPQELEKRIEELRTVQFWLEQNARMLAATIQALDVQRMTLSTLNAMNVPMADLKDVLKTPTGMPGFGFPGEPKAAKPAAQTGRPARPEAETKPRAEADTPSKPDTASATGPGAEAGADADKADAAAATGVDPMQWWGALTQQFTQLAANAMKDPSTGAARDLATSLVKQSIDAAGDAFRQSATMPGTVAANMAKATQAAQAAATAATAAASHPASAAAGKSAGPAAKPSAKAAPRPAAKKSSTAKAPATGKSAGKPAAKAPAKRRAS
ncbi:hypothetical protein CDN99_21180 [Roseateles aquatilis]|uniref:Uncharacterized protein n=1 Tax=Roseateles aquatilis TaxID=431061 RepID=A0A246J1A7_9BURK|nr:PhaM family polyhydroxyalkanoate granule multifunctional regulatory protein [Roseateles aquatilis]OWQ86345.1 hypothetical protein CDN99_21180 [Roseateles aquatilis]